MKRRARLWNLFLVIAAIWILASQTVYADVDWTVLKQVELAAEPLDIAPSVDGKLIYILSPGEVLIYSIAQNQVIDKIPVDKSFDKMSFSEKNSALILSGSSSKTLKLIRVEQRHDIEVSGRPFKGPANALVTIAVFDDYQ